MLLLFVKSQAELFDKIVQVKGGVRADGTVVKPHTAIRHVRHDEIKAAHPAAQTADLFAERPRPKAKPEPKPSATLDMFSDYTPPPPKAEKESKPAPTLATNLDQKSKPKQAVEVAPPVSASVVALSEPAGVDYAKKFSHVHVPEFGVKAGVTKGERRKLNARAAAMVGMTGSDIFEVAKPEPLDPEVLRQYSGNGGCGDSLNEFYTPPDVAAAMWKVLHDLGLPEQSTVLEPSCGAGVFLETAPRGCTVTGVEMDPTSAKIAETLHPRHEVQTSPLEAFAVADTRLFDAVIGNAPFGVRGGLAKQDKDDLSTAEGYFLDTALDKTKDGGLVAMIVPTGVLNGKNSRKLRQRLLCKGQFLGAGRMPNSAFEHSHTDVTTDVLFFRKRPIDVAAALGASQQATLRDLDVWDEDFLSGGYYDAHPENVFGTPGKAMRAFGEIDTVDGSMTGVPQAISDLALAEPKASPTVEQILAVTPTDQKEKIRSAALRRPYDTAKRGDVKVIDGVEYILEGDPLRWHSVAEFAADKAVSDASELGALINRAVGGEYIPDLEDRVNAYVLEHGLPSKIPSLAIAAHKDKAVYAMMGAVKPDGSLSDTVTGRRAKQESTLDVAATALALEDGDGDFTPETLAARWAGGTAETALDQLYALPDYALDPDTGRWTTMDVYATGDLWPKLDRLKAVLAGDEGKPEDRAKYERQLAQLETLIDAKALEDVELTLASGFIPLKVVGEFFGRDGGAALDVTYDKGLYTVRNAKTGGSVYGDGDLLERYLNRSGVKNTDRENEWDTIDAWNRDFKEWLCGSKHRDEVEDLYNRTYKGFRQRAYSEEPMDIPGMANLDKIKPHVWSGVRQALAQRKGILADDVGLGKTVQGLILARMLKANGLAQRPVLVVPKSVLANWAAEIEKWFPGSNYLTLGETFSRDKNGDLKGKVDGPAERARKLHDLRQNDYDFILISQPAWNDVDLDPIVKKEQLDQDFWVQRGDALGNAGDKRLNKIREAYQQAKDKLDFKSRTDAAYFNDLGIDAIIGDEFHAYKNLFAAKNQRGQAPKFLGGSGQSMRAQDTNLKCRWLLDQTGGVNVYGLTATPTKNSPLEIYSMLSHIAPEEFESRGIRNSEDFIGRYVEFESEPILNTRGEIEEAMVTSGFKNLDELRDVMRKYINRRTAEDVGLELPNRDDRQHVVDMTPEQESEYVTLRQQAAEAAGKKDATGEMHIFSIMSRMSKAATDLELLNPTAYPGAHSPKLDAVVKNAAEGAREGGQVIFCENVFAHRKIAKLLAEAGMKPEEIAIFNADEAAESSKRQKISDDFNAGKLKAVIGNSTMEEGVNLQVTTVDIHHVDLPWNAAAMQQRNGRGLRQGNLNGTIRINTYLTKGSFDGYRYQTIAAKKSWQDLLWHGGDRVENLAKEGPVSREDMAVMLAANPEEARAKMAASKEVAMAKFEAEQHSSLSSEFARFRGMRASYNNLKDRQKETDSGRRLKLKLDRLKTSLEANPRLKDKALLDAPHAVVLQPKSGLAIQPGAAFELPGDEKGETPVNGGGKFVVLGFVPGTKDPVVRVRRWGQPTELTLQTNGHRYAGADRSLRMELGELGNAVPFEHSDEAEKAEFAKFAAASIDQVKDWKDLHALPPSVVQDHYDAIQHRVKAGMKDYSFGGGSHYGKVGAIGSDGSLHAMDSYSARTLPDGMDYILPTDAHRKAVEDAYMAMEREKRIATHYPPTSRGRHSSNDPEARARYGHEEHNKWKSVADHHFGEGTSKEWEARAESERSDRARHAPTLKDAIKEVAIGAAGPYGNPKWSKKGLATVWAKAKKDGLLGAPLKDHYHQDLPLDTFTTGYGSNKSRINTMTSVGDVLIKLATESHHGDMAAAMITQTAASPDDKIKALLKLQPGDRAAALSHLVAKHPELAEKTVGSFAGAYTAPEGVTNNPAKYRDWRSMTLAKLAQVEGGADTDEGGEDDRRAA